MIREIIAGENENAGIMRGKPFTKGQIANPLGAKAHNENLKRVRKLTHDAIAEIGQLILDGDIDTITAISKNRKETVLRVWFANIALKAMHKGDWQALNPFLDRVIGKQAQKLEISRGADISESDIRKELERLRAINDEPPAIE